MRHYRGSFVEVDDEFVAPVGDLSSRNFVAQLHSFVREVARIKESRVSVNHADAANTQVYDPEFQGMKEYSLLLY